MLAFHWVGKLLYISGKKCPRNPKWWLHSYASPAEYLCTSSETDNSAQPLLTAEEENQNAKKIPTKQKQKSGDVKRSQDCGTKFKFVSPESNSKLLKLLENH